VSTSRALRASHRGTDVPSVHAGRPTRREWWAGGIAGATAGAVMALAMMLYATFTMGSPWVNPNLIAAMWLGPHVAGTRLSGATLLGFGTHMITSALMGVIAVPWIYRLPTGRSLLAALAYALASYPLVFAAVMSWADPIMVQRTGLVPMAAAHALFGLVLGALYVRIAGVPARYRDVRDPPPNSVGVTWPVLCLAQTTGRGRPGARSAARRRLVPAVPRAKMHEDARHGHDGIGHGGREQDLESQAGTDDWPWTWPVVVHPDEHQRADDGTDCTTNDDRAAAGMDHRSTHARCWLG